MFQAQSLPMFADPTKVRVYAIETDEEFIRSCVNAYSNPHKVASSYVDLVEHVVTDYANIHVMNIVWIEVVRSPREVDVFLIRTEEEKYIRNVQTYTEAAGVMSQTRFIYKNLDGEFPKMFVRRGWDRQEIFRNEPAILLPCRRSDEPHLGSLIPDFTTHNPDTLRKQLQLINTFKPGPRNNKVNKVVWRGTSSGFQTVSNDGYGRLTRFNIVHQCNEVHTGLTDTGFAIDRNASAYRDAIKKVSAKYCPVAEPMTPAQMAHEFTAILSIQGHSFSGSLGWSLGNGNAVSDYAEEYV